MNIMFLLKQALSAILYSVGHIVSPHNILDIEEDEAHNTATAHLRGGTTFRFSRRGDRLVLKQAIHSHTPSPDCDGQIMVTTELGYDLWVDPQTGLFHCDAAGWCCLPSNGVSPVMLAKPLPAPGVTPLESLEYYGYDKSGLLVHVIPYAE